jgi:hypothetical protein
MATLMALYDADGKMVGRCDERCYDGSGDRCKCICGGINHHVGIRKAAAQSLALTVVDEADLYVCCPKRPLSLKKSQKLWVLAHPVFAALEEKPR